MATAVIEASDDDPIRLYTPEEGRRLTEQLTTLTRAVHAGELRERPLDLSLLRQVHAALFDGVRAHAGRIRARGCGSEYLVFGPHRSEHRDRVEEKLQDVFSRLHRKLRLHDERDEAYEENVITLAVWFHAEIIRIHPFEDGNGRTSRACASHLLVQHGLRPVAIEAVKQDYTEALNHYFRARDITPLVDLYVSLYPVER